MIPAAGGRIGMLLVNLGTPDSTGYWAMRRYLKEFLSDRRVIEENRLKWWLVLNLIILTVRPGRKGRDYDKIWNRERDELPLKTITRSQSDKLDELMEKVDKRIRVDWAMRYGNPSIRSRLEALAAQDCERILIVPLYPQYAAATTATVCDEVFRALGKMRFSRRRGRPRAGGRPRRHLLVPAPSVRPQPGSHAGGDQDGGRRSDQYLAFHGKTLLQGRFHQDTEPGAGTAGIAL